GEICGEKGEILDQALISLFRAPRSYTGEDVIEISTHGGMTVSRHILDLLIRKGARHAEPGEFTKRAFLNGKMDLTQAEAVLDLIKARSEKSLEAALRQLTGKLSQRFKILKDQLMELYAHMEAFLDFPDEQLEVYSDGEMLEKLHTIRAQIDELLSGFKRGILLREGVVAAIVGSPNVGKSSLFNALLERDRALVSEYPGTTRDSLEEAIEIKGHYIKIVDTAGLSPMPGHPLDQMGMERTRKILNEAHLFLYMLDGSRPLTDSDSLIFHHLPEKVPVLILVNKSDLALQIDMEKIRELTGEEIILPISTKTRQGLDQLEIIMGDLVFRKHLQPEGEQIIRLRHKNILETAKCALIETENALSERRSLEFVITDLKRAIDSLRELIGEIYSEDLLDVIFSEFCIGK
ncbi:MAG TPA: tRNA uridine-5-carboxymethylaminomethyl(34) synthesis GTPase MnmE, partial [bacterium]|nr:tRNA uridine-5-carboxymethylaminomethyl(34) synthesis GTPase MnmE [bacterium]